MENAIKKGDRVRCTEAFVGSVAANGGDYGTVGQEYDVLKVGGVGSNLIKLAGVPNAASSEWVNRRRFEKVEP